MTLKFNQGKSLFKTEGDAHFIEVRENRRYRWLHFGGPSIQSAMDLKQPDAFVLPYMTPMSDGMKHLMPQPKSICMLGLGGGSFVRHFYHHFPDTDLTVIEIDDLVCTIATEFFDLPDLGDRYHLVQADAYEFLEINHTPFDVIFSDIYSDESLPEILEDQAFYQCCYDNLSDEGLLVANIIPETDAAILPILAKIKSVFNDQTLCLPISQYRNIIVFASKSKTFKKQINDLVGDKILNSATLDPEYGLCAESFRETT